MIGEDAWLTLLKKGIGKGWFSATFLCQLKEEIENALLATSAQREDEKVVADKGSLIPVESCREGGGASR